MHQLSENFEMLFKYEREKRKNCEEDCKHLMVELESRECEIEKLRKTLLTRVSDAELQMDKLVELRKEESERAQSAILKLRSCIEKLQQRHAAEKEEMQRVLEHAHDSIDGQVSELRDRLKQTEADRDALSKNLRNAELCNSRLTSEVSDIRSEMNQLTTRLSHVTRSNSELTASLDKLKKDYGKAVQRAENAGKQLCELRKQSEKITASNSQSEQSLRTAIERRAAAESALSMVRQRADAQSQRVVQLERELAAERARLEEKSSASDAEIQKLRRRLATLRNEVDRLRQELEAAQELHENELHHSEQIIQQLTDRRLELESKLKQAESRTEATNQMMECLKQQITSRATAETSRLLAALSTGEEGVTTALELKRMIDERLEPELQTAKQTASKATAEVEEWRTKYDATLRELNHCRSVLAQAESQISEKRSISPTMLEDVTRQLKQAKEALDVKTTELTTMEEKLHKSEQERQDLHTKLTELESSSRDTINQLHDQLNQLKVKYEVTSERVRTASRLIAKLKATRKIAASNVTEPNGPLLPDADDDALTNQLAAVKEKLAKAESRVVDLERLCEQRQASQSSLEEHYECIINQLNERLHMEVSRAEHLQSLLEATGANQQASPRSQMLLHKLDTSIDVAELLEMKEKELNELRETMMDRISHARQELEASQQRSSELERERRELEQRLEQTRCALSREQHENIQIRERISELNQEILKYKAEKIELAASMTTHSENLFNGPSGDSPEVRYEKVTVDKNPRTNGVLSNGFDPHCMGSPHDPLDVIKSTVVETNALNNLVTSHPHNSWMVQEVVQISGLSPSMSYENLWDADDVATELEQLIASVNQQFDCHQL